MSNPAAPDASAPTPTQPDIAYHPDWDKYLARRARRLAADHTLPQTPLPPGFPARLEGPIVWEGADWEYAPMADSGDKLWVYRLSEDDLREIDAALHHFNGLGLAQGYVGQATFPLPSLGKTLQALARELYSGRGFFVLRALPVDAYSRADLFTIYAGISAHVGPTRGKQDATGAVLAHITDMTRTPAATAVTGAADKQQSQQQQQQQQQQQHPIGNSAYTTDKQVFHTDVGDLIALLALETAWAGGTSRLSSAARVYNELAATRPDLVGVLAGEWVVDSFGGTPGYTTRPLLHRVEAASPSASAPPSASASPSTTSPPAPPPHIILQYSRRHFTGYGPQPRTPGIPPISEAQAEALDAVHFLAERYSLGLDFRRGDVQFINSLGLLHARDGYVDGPEEGEGGKEGGKGEGQGGKGKKRYLVRLWLRNEELAWPTPEPLRPIWERLYSVRPEEQRFPVEPEIRRKESGKTK